MNLKYKILKAIDVAGLSFLSPVVRLVTGEEPAKQLRDIGRFIIVPVTAFLIFLWLWTVVAPKHRTKAGEVPTPAVVWDAGKGIWRFHERESTKAEGYRLTGGERRSELQRATERLAEVKELEEIAERQVTAAREASEERFNRLVAPSKQAYESLKEEYRRLRRANAEELRTEAESLLDAGAEARLAYLEKVRDAAAREAELRERVEKRKEAYAEAEQTTFPEVKEALRARTLLGEEKQHLTKYIDMLGDGSRETKLEEAESRLANTREQFLHTGEGDLYRLANGVINQEEFVETTASSEYAKPWTLPRQIVRSLFCVFTGFMIATGIAIPIGILCGLSPTFMAAMTPFIALFKPVSPLVWLPIVMIIVGGFMPDPEGHWLIAALNEIPIIKEYGIDPMFLSSAITVALCSLWATLVNTALGVGSIDKDHLNVARVLRLGFFSRLFKIIVPTALPLIFAGLRISLGVGWMVLVAAEILSTSEGIGKFVNDMYTNGSSQSFAQMFVVVFIVGFIGMVLDRIMVFFQRLVSFDTAPAI